MNSLLFVALLSAGQVQGPCSTPKGAVVNWLENLQPDSYSEAAAARCAVATGETEQQLVHLKRVLDSRGIMIRVEGLSDDPAFKDGKGQSRQLITSRLPNLYVAKAGDRWLISKETLQEGSKIHAKTFSFDIEGLVDALPGWARQNLFGVAVWQVFGLGFLILIGLALRLLVAKLVTSQVMNLLKSTRLGLTVDVIRPSALPLGNMTLAGAIGVGVPSLALPVRFAEILLLGVRIVAVVSMVMLVYRLVDVLSAYMQKRAQKTESKLDDQLVPLVRRGLKLITVVVGVIFVLHNMEIEVFTLMAPLGIGSLAFALGAKDTLANLFGSITIFLDKPFQIGDWVQTAGVEGVVHEVGFRSTRIRTFYDSLVTVPNGTFTDAIVDNYGLRTYRRTSTKLGLTYDTTPEQMEAFCDGVRGIIKAHPKTRKDYYEVHFVGYGDSGLEVMLYFFFDVASWSEELRSRHEVYLDIWRLAHKLGVGFAFPTRTLHIDSQAAPTSISPKELFKTEELKDAVDGFGPGGGDVVPPGQRVHPGFFAGSESARGG